MEINGFQVAYPATHKHQIELKSEEGIDLTEIIESKVIHRLQLLFAHRSGKVKLINDFLDFHFKISTNKEDLLNLLTRITKPDVAYKFKPYSLAIGIVQDWKSEKEKVKIVQKKIEEIKITKPKKTVNFESHILNKEKFEIIEKRLGEYKYVDDNGKWANPLVELAALARLLVNHEVIKKTSAQLAASLFKERYKSGMNAKPFQKSCNIKRDTMERIEKDCGLS